MPFMNLKLTNPLIHARLILFLVFRFNVYGLIYIQSDVRKNAFGYGEDGLLSGLLLIEKAHNNSEFQVLNVSARS